MPTYEYICGQCGHEMEAFQRMSEDPLVQCPACAADALKRKIGRGAGIIFKGSGFYETDFKDKKGSRPVESAPEKESSSEGTEKKDRASNSSSSKSSGAAPARATD